MAEPGLPGGKVRYTAEELFFLRESPLCSKPSGLPPAEEWMGPPPDPRAQTKPTTERTKSLADVPLAEHRRPGLDRTLSRTNAHPEDIRLAPPKTNFASASIRSNKLADLDRFAKDGDLRDRPDRMFRTKTDTDVHDRFKDALRRPRGDNDQDGEGWSTVKPRKSFGHEGAERFNTGRMGGNFTTPRDDKKPPRERDERDNGDRRTRTFDQHARDKDGEDGEVTRWNGSNARTKVEREPRVKENSEGAPLNHRERIDRAKSWRDRIPDDKPVERNTDRQADRGYDRRYDRDHHHRNERSPEWSLSDPLEESKSSGPTKEDMESFLRQQRARDKGGDKPTPASNVKSPEPHVEIQKRVVSLSAVEAGPDKFFAAYGGGAVLDMASPAAEVRQSSHPKPAARSKFTAFFSNQGSDALDKTEPSTPAPATPAFNEDRDVGEAERKAMESMAFHQNILQKLQKSSFGGQSSSPQASRPSAPPQASGSFSEHQSGLGSGSLAAMFPNMAIASQQSGSAVTSPIPFQQYGGGDRREEMRAKLPQQQQQQQQLPLGQDILSPRPLGPPSQPPAPRQEPNVQEFSQRHSGYGGMLPNNRMEQSPGPVSSKDNNMFLLQLMQSKFAPELRRNEQMPGRMSQPPPQVNNLQSVMNQGRPPANMPTNEMDMHRERERSSSQRQMRPNGPSDFFDQFHPAENDNRPQQPPQPQQPTQILQRPPPGLDHHFNQLRMGPGPMPSQQPMIPPPPGLMNRDPRTINFGPPVPGMFPPNFPPGAFPPPPNGLPEGLVGGPGPVPGVGPGGPGGPRNMQPPPGFHGGPPPPGFMMSGGPPPPNMGGGFPGPGGPGPDFGIPLPPFDGRNMPPPPGASARAFGRQ